MRVASKPKKEERMISVHVRSILLTGSDESVEVQVTSGSTLRNVLRRAKTADITFTYGKLVVGNRTVPLSALDDMKLRRSCRILFVEEERPAIFDLDSL